VALQVDSEALKMLGTLQQLQELDVTVGAADLDVMLEALSSCPLLRVRRAAACPRARCATQHGAARRRPSPPARPAPRCCVQVLRLDYDSLPALLEDPDGDDGLDMEPELEEALAGGWARRLPLCAPCLPAA
jgi:hypothetical protein